MNCWLLINLFLFMAFGKNFSSEIQLVTVTDFVKVIPSRDWHFSPGEKKIFTIVFAIEHGYHIQANQPIDENLIPTQITVFPHEGITVHEPNYPNPVPFHLKNDESKMLVYHGNMKIRLPISTRVDVKRGNHQITGVLKYQACDSVKCYFPRELPFNIILEIK